MHWRLDSTARKPHLQLSHPHCRGIQKSIETLIPVWEQEMLRTAAFDLCSAAFRFSATVAFSDELLRETDNPAVLPQPHEGPHYTLSDMRVNQEPSIAKWSRHIKGNDHHSLYEDPQLSTPPKSRVAHHALRQLHRLTLGYSRTPRSHRTRSRAQTIWAIRSHEQYDQQYVRFIRREICVPCRS
jgi:hypothetical protein